MFTFSLFIVTFEINYNIFIFVINLPTEGNYNSKLI